MNKEKEEIMAAIDKVCMNCVEDTLRTKVCEYCPVRNLADSLNEKIEEE